MNKDAVDKFKKEISKEAEKNMESPAFMNDAKKAFRNCLTLAIEYKALAIRKGIEPSEFIGSLILALELVRDRSPNKEAFDIMIQGTFGAVRDLVQEMAEKENG